MFEITSIVVVTLRRQRRIQTLIPIGRSLNRTGIIGGLFSREDSLGPNGVFDRFESTRLIVEVPQVVVHEADEPDVLGGLLHAHLLAGKHLTEIDLAPLVADAAATDPHAYLLRATEAAITEAGTVTLPESLVTAAPAA